MPRRPVVDRTAREGSPRRFAAKRCFLRHSAARAYAAWKARHRRYPPRFAGGGGSRDGAHRRGRRRDRLERRDAPRDVRRPRHDAPRRAGPRHRAKAPLQLVPATLPRHASTLRGRATLARRYRGRRHGEARATRHPRRATRRRAEHALLRVRPRRATPRPGKLRRRALVPSDPIGPAEPDYGRTFFAKHEYRED